MNDLMTVATGDVLTYPQAHGLLTMAPAVVGDLISRVEPVSLDGLRANPLLDEYLRAVVLDRLGPGVARLALREAVGRVVLADVEPARRVDPPVPLVLFSELPMGEYLGGVRDFLHDRLASPLRAAIDGVVWSAVGVLSPVEMMYFYLKGLSLVTGAYNNARR